ncbi:glycosyltransferase family 8 protein [Clostridium beijerinckii NRRL B-598]|nr:glycosyltransferase family 8 protein [Clostridium beijerinckii NRRL B-598]
MLDRRENSMHIVYASDDNFAEIMGVSIVSLFENNKDMEEIVIYILDSGINDKNKKRIESVFQKYNRCNPLWITATNINVVLGMKVNQDRGSLSQFARLFVSRVLPKELDRVLYLDCDITIDKSLNELWNMDMKGKIVAALQDAFAPWYRKNLGLRENDIMFNSGVMLIDLNRWKEEHVEEKILRFIKKYNGLVPQGDQGVLNAILSSETEPLNPRFNSVTIFHDFTYENMLIYRKPPIFYSKEEIKEAVTNPVIIHFTTSFLSKRAWIEGSEHPYAKRWQEYKSISPWKDEPLRKHTSSKKWKDAYVKMYKVLPLGLSVRISGLLQAYGRPIIEKIKYNI